MFIARILEFAFSLYEFGLLAYVLCSWIMHPAACAIRQWLAPAYELVLVPIRRWIPAPRLGGTAIDLSPIFLFIALGLVRRLVIAIF
ncbi:YggT family protein [Pontiellaceae bacterium B1224]|nr:YggT family protein [Pontiellaceae bacterium B1224]